MSVLSSICSLARLARPDKTQKSWVGVSLISSTFAHQPWPPLPAPVLELRDSWGIVIELDADLEAEPTALLAAAASEPEDPAAEEAEEAPAAGFDPE